MRIALFWVITQRVVVISYRCFGTTYRFHLQGTLKIGQIGCPETSLWNYQICRQKQLTPKYISRRVNGKNRQSL
jgi:hypothetical protein